MGIDPISIGLMAVGVGVSAFGQIGAMGEQKKMLNARQAMTNFQEQQQRLQQVRQARIQSAKIVQAGVNQGVGSSESSAVKGGAQNVVGQEESNLGVINTEASLTNTIFNAQRAETGYNAISELGKGVQDFGSFMGSNEGQKAIGDIFG